MDTSSSSEEVTEVTSSEGEIESSIEDDSEKLETAKICGATLELPQGLCENEDIFKEFFSLKMWNSLSEIHKQHLKNFLPSFPENDEQEKDATLQMLFNKEKFRFHSPLMKFQEKLKAGHFRPDIANLKNLLRQIEKRECKYQQERYYKKLICDIIKSRKRLMNVCVTLPPGIEPKMDKYVNDNLNSNSIAFRTKRRYFEEISMIKSIVKENNQWSDDENYPEGPPVQLSKRQKRHLNGLQGNAALSCGVERTVGSTLSQKPSGLDLELSITSTYNPYQLNDDSYKTLLNKHKRRKLELDSSPELLTKGISVKDIAQRAQLLPMKKTNGKVTLSSVSNSEFKPPKKKVKVEPVNYKTNNNRHVDTIKQPPISSDSEPDYSDSDSFIDPVLSPVQTPKSKSSRSTKPKSSSRSSKVKPTSLPELEPIKPKPEPEILKPEPEPTFPTPALSPISQYSNRIMPATLSDLDGIDMMNLPVDLDDSNIDILDEMTVKQELMQDTHSNFLSLIRDIICSTVDHRISLADLQNRLKTWQENPISPLNDWYSTSDNWLKLLPSAINFLTGETNEQPEDFVPYLEYKPILQLYQWIGAGRDSDNSLSRLCSYWLDHRDDAPIVNNNSQEVEIDIIEKPQTPPPPRCPTQWTVRKAELEEIEQFREQERQRYSNPHKAFTYRMNGYESVVGPVKGMYNQTAGVSKARGHSMLSADRPNFVTILTLVRDATARLPNGEGTRADICELLKSSQYIAHASPENVLQSVVSGALDRMHTEFDPCVKYDTKRKIWIYLHRNRTEADFERIHQQCQGMNKNTKKRKSKPKPKQDKATKSTTATNKSSSETTVAATITTTTSTVTVDKSAKTFKTPVCRNFASATASATTTNTQIPALSPSKQVVNTSLLVNSNIASRLKSSPEKIENPVTIKTLLPTASPTLVNSNQLDRSNKVTSSKQDIEETLQNLNPIRVNSPSTKQITSPKSNKNVVKIVNSPQGKSLITPSAAGTVQQSTVFIKQVDQKSTGTKQIITQPHLTQQLLQTIAAQQQKQLKVNQQIVQINQQQKPITVTTQLLKTIDTKTPQANQQIIQPQTNISQQIIQAINQQKQNQNNVLTTTPQQQQQQQIIHNFKQKVAQQNQQTVLTLQQAVLKQQANIQQLQKQLQQQQQLAKGTSLLGQQRIITQVAKPVVTQAQTPLVAKVLTNAAGQVISVESLLAHQKQHGTLPQGTTLRVTGGKPGQTNLIQLPGNVPNQVTQFAVVSQNNLASIANQARLTTTITTQSNTPSGTTVVNTGKILPNNKNHLPIVKSSPPKFIPSKLAQQLVNAKFISQNKLVLNQATNQIKINTTATTAKPTVTVAAKTIAGASQPINTVRMVNATGLNLAIAGKPVLLASKSNLQGQNVILQAQPTISTSNAASLVLPASAARVISQTSTTQSQVVLGPQLKVQTAGISLGPTQTQPNQGQTVVLGSHAIKMQTGAGPANQQRVVLASQGQGGQLVAQQILLPSGFQGGAINIKTLQGLKVIPFTQTQPAKGRPQQVFARIMNPSRITQVSSTTTSQIDGGGNQTNTD